MHLPENADPGSLPTRSLSPVVRWLVFTGIIFLGPAASLEAVDFLPGDYNQDGRVNLLDAQKLLFFITEQEPPTSCPASGDVNGDCKIGIDDVTELLARAFGGDPPGRRGMSPGPCVSADDDGFCPGFGLFCETYPERFCEGPPGLEADRRFQLYWSGPDSVEGPPGSRQEVRLELRLRHPVAVGAWAAALRLDTVEGAPPVRILDITIPEASVEALSFRRHEFRCDETGESCPEAILAAIPNPTSGGYRPCRPPECEEPSSILSVVWVEVTVPESGSTTTSLRLLESNPTDPEEPATHLGEFDESGPSILPLLGEHTVQVSAIEASFENLGSLHLRARGPDADGWLWIPPDAESAELDGELVLDSRTDRVTGWKAHVEIRGEQAWIPRTGCVEIECLEPPLLDLARESAFGVLDSDHVDEPLIFHRARLVSPFRLPRGIYPLTTFGLQVGAPPAGVARHLELVFPPETPLAPHLIDGVTGEQIRPGGLLRIQSTSFHVQSYTELRPGPRTSFVLDRATPRQLFRIPTTSPGGLRVIVDGDPEPTSRRVVFGRSGPPSSVHFDGEAARSFRRGEHVLELEASEQPLWVLVITEPTVEPLTLEIRAIRETVILTDSSVDRVARIEGESFTSRITGVGLDLVSRYSLFHPNTQQVIPGELLQTTGVEARVRFELSGQEPPGFYVLQARDRDGEVQAELARAVEIVEPGGGQLLEFRLLAPAEHRNGHGGIAEIEILHRGDRETSAPLLRVEVSSTTTDTELSLDGETWGSTLDLSGSDRLGIPGRLAPGARVRIPVHFIKNSPGPAELVLLRFLPSASEPLSAGAWAGPADEELEAEWTGCFLPRVETRLLGLWSLLESELAGQCDGLRREGLPEHDARLALARLALDLDCSGELATALEDRPIELPDSPPLYFPVAGARVRVLGSLDPNEKDDQDTGEDVLLTFPDQYPQGWKQGATLAVDETIEFRIQFQNKPCDEEDLIGGECFRAPARIVEITDTLAPEYDFCSIELAGVQFAGGLSFLLEPLQEFEYCLAPRQYRSVQTHGGPENEPFDGYVVEVMATVDPSSRTIEWVLTTLDPETCDEVPGDPDAYQNCSPPGYPHLNVGFLPPDDDVGSGSGSVSFRARLDPVFFPPALPDPPTPQNEATITFDPGENEPLITPMLVQRVSRGPPDAPRFPVPSSGPSPTVDRDVELGWEPSLRANEYRVELYASDHAEPGARLLQENVLTAGLALPFLLEPGRDHFWQVVAINEWGESAATTAGFRTDGGPCFVRGDSSADGLLDVTDPVVTLTYLFVDPSVVSCLAALNTNGDVQVDISDVVYTLSYLFLGEAPPPEPAPDNSPFYDPAASCGASTSPLDLELGCESFAPCADTCP